MNLNLDDGDMSIIKKALCLLGGMMAGGILCSIIVFIVALIFTGSSLAGNWAMGGFIIGSIFTLISFLIYKDAM